MDAKDVRIKISACKKKEKGPGTSLKRIEVSSYYEGYADKDVDCTLFIALLIS